MVHLGNAGEDVGEQKSRVGGVDAPSCCAPVLLAARGEYANCRPRQMNLREQEMIFEMRTYLMKPGTIPQVEEAFATALPGRLKLSPLAGFWRTEVGMLNQIIHVWPY